jgi:hypothetical protein
MSRFLSIIFHSQSVVGAIPPHIIIPDIGQVQEVNMWVVCKLVADREAEPKRVTGTWPNGAEMSGLIYPDKAKPLIEDFGQHKTRYEAVKCMVLTFHPELKESSKEHIQRVSKNYLSGSMKLYKVLNQK